MTIDPTSIPSPNFIHGYKKESGAEIPAYLKTNPDNSLIVDNTPVVARRIVYHASGQPEYIGEAKAGGVTSEAVWRIRKMTFDGSNRVTAVEWADGDSEFDNIWDNYATLSYS